MRQLGTTDLELLETLFEHLADCPFFVKDQELKYVAANGAMARLCGVPSVAKLYGLSVADFFPAALAARYEALDAQVLASGRAIANVLEQSTAPGGEPTWLLYSRAPVRALDGTTVGVAASSRRLKRADLGEAACRRLEVLTERLAREFDKPLRLADLAAQVDCAASQLERDFRRLFSMTPQAFLHQARLKEAMRRLEDKSRTIASIAHECGYADQSAFTRRFLQVTGLTPTQYRLQRRGGRPAQAQVA